MEALACRRAVQFVMEIRLRRVIFDGDSALVINAITQGGAEFLPMDTSLKTFAVLLRNFNLSILIMLVVCAIVLLML